jgi:alpha-tubulin suppressor-like RCC1 family protein
MSHLRLLPSPSAPRTRGGRVPQLAGRLGPVLAILVGAALGCGEDTESPTSPPDPTPALAITSTAALSFAQISAGTEHSCGVTTTHRAYCWGRNSGGQLGDGTKTSRPRPVPVVGGLQFLRVSAGGAHTCGITTTNRAYCWGLNDDGQLGDGTHGTTRLRPVAVAGGHSFRQVSAGLDHTCAVTPWDVAFCWGNNNQGKLGTTGFTHFTPTRVGGGLLFRQVIAGALHTCGATTSFQGYCWGANGNGQLGNGNTNWSATPVAVAGGLRFRMVVAGGGIVLIPSEQPEQAYSCGITTGDLAYCWGENVRSVFGDGGIRGASRVPVAVAGGHRFRGINLSYDHVCAVTLWDVAFCWGGNDDGQVGDGTTTDRSRPVRVAGGLQFRAVTTNPNSKHSCGVTIGNRAYCWGLNQGGQLGDGATTGPERCTLGFPCSTKPEAVVGPS